MFTRGTGLAVLLGMETSLGRGQFKDFQEGVWVIHWVLLLLGGGDCSQLLLSVTEEKIKGLLRRRGLGVVIGETHYKRNFMNKFLLWPFC